ncbi:hypothetical protein C5E16_15390 [Clavibacter michiganensis]|uniref:Uncharacterized protein n=1 Tax=Clavibacter michiganensis TaxID=28447 RepID=A0A2S5VL45_9MICO|nr:hypothetical protein [Clavibacter michiganensis]PPF63529.1 hypothetical protein C5E16_15390 [Clavibacter michiganensis]
MDQLLSRLDRIAAGRQAGHVIAEDMRDHPFTARAFRWIRWILVAETFVGAAAVATALTLAADGVDVAPAVWFRSFVVLAMTVTLYYFAWRASAGYWWAYSRLRLFSQVFPVVTLVIAAIPGLYPLWMVIEQIVFSLLLTGVADILRSDHMRDAFPKPPRSPRGAGRGPTARPSGDAAA